MANETHDENAVRPHIRVVKSPDTVCDSCGTLDNIFEVRLPVKTFLICPRCFWEMKIQMRDITATHKKP